MLSGSSGKYCESDAILFAKFAESGFGFEEDGKVVFLPLECAYLAYLKKAEIKGHTLESFIRQQSKEDKGFPFAFAVYSAIRSLGRIVRPYPQAPGFLRVYAPGVGREENRPSQLVCLLPGKAPSLKSIEGQVAIAHKARLDLIIACGAENAIRFYKVSAFNF